MSWITYQLPYSNTLYNSMRSFDISKLNNYPILAFADATKLYYAEALDYDPESAADWPSSPSLVLSHASDIWCVRVGITDVGGGNRVACIIFTDVNSNVFKVTHHPAGWVSVNITSSVYQYVGLGSINQKFIQFDLWNDIENNLVMYGPMYTITGTTSETVFPYSFIIDDTYAWISYNAHIDLNGDSRIFHNGSVGGTVCVTGLTRSQGESWGWDGGYSWSKVRAYNDPTDSWKLLGADGDPIYLRYDYSSSTQFLSSFRNTVQVDIDSLDDFGIQAGYLKYVSGYRVVYCKSNGSNHDWWEAYWNGESWDLIDLSISFPSVISNITCGLRFISTLYGHFAPYSDGANLYIIKEASAVVVNIPPVANFTYLPADPEENESIVFDANSSSDSDGFIVQYDWDFDGDGTYELIDGASIQTFAFPTAGDYLVCVRVTDNDGATDSFCDTVTVVEVEPEPVDPVAVLIANPTTGSSPAAVTLEDGGSYDPDGYIVKWELNFQDYITGEVGWFDINVADQIDHIYTSPLLFGNQVYYPLLRVTDNSGATNVDSVTITVTPHINLAPTACFTYIINPVILYPRQVAFTSCSTDNEDSAASLIYLWDFGDGNVSVQQNPSHDYAAAGSYNVSLTVTDSGGLQDTVIHTITLGEVTELIPPVAVIDTDVITGVSPLTVNFDGSDSYDLDGTISTYAWDLNNDGVYETNGITTSAEFVTAGAHTVWLKVIDNDGLIDTESVIILVTAAPISPIVVVETPVDLIDSTEINETSDVPVEVNISISDRLKKTDCFDLARGKCFPDYNKKRVINDGSIVIREDTDIAIVKEDTLFTCDKLPSIYGGGQGSASPWQDINLVNKQITTEIVGCGKTEHDNYLWTQESQIEIYGSAGGSIIDRLNILTGYKVFGFQKDNGAGIIFNELDSEVPPYLSDAQIEAVIDGDTQNCNLIQETAGECKDRLKEEALCSRSVINISISPDKTGDSFTKYHYERTGKEKDIVDFKIINGEPAILFRKRVPHLVQEYEYDGVTPLPLHYEDVAYGAEYDSERDESSPSNLLAFAYGNDYTEAEENRKITIKNFFPDVGFTEPRVVKEVIGTRASMVPVPVGVLSNAVKLAEMYEDDGSTVIPAIAYGQKFTRSALPIGSYTALDLKIKIGDDPNKEFTVPAVPLYSFSGGIFNLGEAFYSYSVIGTTISYNGSTGNPPPGATYNVGTINITWADVLAIEVEPTDTWRFDELYGILSSAYSWPWDVYGSQVIYSYESPAMVLDMIADLEGVTDYEYIPGANGIRIEKTGLHPVTLRPYVLYTVTTGTPVDTTVPGLAITTRTEKKTVLRIAMATSKTPTVDPVDWNKYTLANGTIDPDDSTQVYEVEYEIGMGIPDDPDRALNISQIREASIEFTSTGRPYVAVSAFTLLGTSTILMDGGSGWSEGDSFASSVLLINPCDLIQGTGSYINPRTLRILDNNPVFIASDSSGSFETNDTSNGLFYLRPNTETIPLAEWRGVELVARPASNQRLVDKNTISPFYDLFDVDGEPAMAYIDYMSRQWYNIPSRKMTEQQLSIEYARRDKSDDRTSYTETSFDCDRGI